MLVFTKENPNALFPKALPGQERKDSRLDLEREAPEEAENLAVMSQEPVLTVPTVTQSLARNRVCPVALTRDPLKPEVGSEVEQKKMDALSNDVQFLGVATAFDEGHESCNVINEPCSGGILERGWETEQAVEYHQEFQLGNLCFALIPQAEHLLIDPATVPRRCPCGQTIRSPPEPCRYPS